MTTILNYITNTIKLSITSLTSAAVGTGYVIIEDSQLSAVNTAFQHAAWSVAILAGLMTMINLFFPLRRFYDEHKKEKLLKKSKKAKDIYDYYEEED